MERPMKSMSVKVKLDTKSVLPVSKTRKKYPESKRPASFIYHTYTHTHTYVYKKKVRHLTSTWTQIGEHHD